mgnify:CR=1 FL=1
MEKIVEVIKEVRVEVFKEVPVEKIKIVEVDKIKVANLMKRVKPKSFKIFSQSKK